MATFHWVADNLRQSFRALAPGRPRANVLELPGVSIASLGVSFQMFNAAFLSEPVETQAQLEERLRAAKSHFDARSIPWALWVCEDFVAPGLRRRLSRTCESIGLRMSAEMPGMLTERIRRPKRPLPAIDVRRVRDSVDVDDFRAVGSLCFRVPPAWFAEVFDSGVASRDFFVCWVGYQDGVPVATAATVYAEGTLGVYNVGTLPAHRNRGYGEAITRFAIDAAIAQYGPSRIVLQSTSSGFGLYERMGFNPVTHVMVYNSVGR